MNSDKYLQLEEGMEFANYKDLCRFLEIKPTTGNAKLSHIETWKRHFEFKRIGNRYKILAIYPEPLFNIQNYGVYAEYVKSLLLDLLCNEMTKGKNRIMITGNQLLYGLNMVNQNYINYKTDYKGLSNVLEIPEEHVNDFYFNINGKIVNTLKSSLNSLKRQSFIQYNIIMVLMEDYNTREANVNERELITEFTNKVYKELKCRDYTDVIRKGLTNKYRNRMKELFKDTKELENVDIWYMCYDIVFIKAIREERLNIYKLLELDKQEKRIELNQLLVDNYKQSYIDRQNTIIEIDRDIGNSLTKWDIMRLNDDYVNNGKRLIDYTIKNK